MLIDEDRLRELYAAGEIDLEHLERSLDIINRRRAVAENQALSETAPAPMTYEDREKKLDAIMSAQEAAPRRRRPTGPPCPRCRAETRAVVEYGVQTAWCASCHAYAGPDPRLVVQQEEQVAHDGYIVGGVIFPLDGGLFG